MRDRARAIDPRLAKTVPDCDRDAFRRWAFDYVATDLQNSGAELSARNADINSASISNGRSSAGVPTIRHPNPGMNLADARR